MKLSELQTGFRSWLEDGNEHFAAMLGKNARHGLDVYQNNYRAQLRACLRGAYPITLEWLGWTTFNDAADCHISSCHPTSWTLDAYPFGFDETLKARFPADPEVHELAQLEWALGEAFISRDASPVSHERLVDIDWDSAVIRFAPSLAIHRFHTNAPEIWSALKQGTPSPSPLLRKEQGALIVWRSAERSQFRTLDVGEAEALQAAGAGSRFGDLCGRFVASDGTEGAIALIGGWLGRWIADGLVTGIDE